MPEATPRVQGPGRPHKYELTTSQVTRIRKHFEAGRSFSYIMDKVGVPEYAVLRVRRAMRAEGL